MSDRVYRPVEPSDYPLLVLGKLKAFYKGNNVYYPATLVSTKMRSDTTHWIVHETDSKDLFATGNDRIYIDVTPEQRFAVWNHKVQRFCVLKSGLSNVVDNYKTKAEAEIEVDHFCHKHGYDRSNYYVIPFNLPETGSNV